MTLGTLTKALSATELLAPKPLRAQGHFASIATNLHVVGSLWIGTGFALCGSPDSPQIFPRLGLVQAEEKLVVDVATCLRWGRSSFRLVVLAVARLVAAAVLLLFVFVVFVVFAVFFLIAGYQPPPLQIDLNPSVASPVPRSGVRPSYGVNHSAQGVADLRAMEVPHRPVGQSHPG